MRCNALLFLLWQCRWQSALAFAAIHCLMWASALSLSCAVQCWRYACSRLRHSAEAERGVIEMRGADFSWLSCAWAGQPDKEPQAAPPSGGRNGARPRGGLRAVRGSIGNLLKAGRAGDGTNGSEAAPSEDSLCDDAPEAATIPIVANINPAAEPGSLSPPSSSSLTKPPKTAPPTLRAPRFRVQRGQLVGICGEVGCGKSSLLAALLGELQPVPQPGYTLGDAIVGAPVVTGRVAYCQQAPWIEAGTVRENVEFGSTLDEARCDA